MNHYLFFVIVDLVSTEVALNIIFHFNPLQASSAFHMETSNLILASNQMTGFYK